MPAIFDTVNKVIELDSSITDLPLFHEELRNWEGSAAGVINPSTHTWKALNLGSGAYFYQCDIINGWKLKFTVPGSYSINGNLNATILAVPDVFIDRKTSSAYTTTSQGSTGPSAAAIAAELLAQLESSTLAKQATVQEAVMAAKLAVALSA